VDWSVLLLAFALMLVFEGLMPLAFPQRWREVFRKLLDLSDGQIRFIGMACVGAGLLLFLLLF
jgi:uncharacterized protein